MENRIQGKLLALNRLKGPSTVRKVISIFYTRKYSATVMNRSSTFAHISNTGFTSKNRNIKIIRRRLSSNEEKTTHTSSFMSAMKILWLLLNREEKYDARQTTDHVQTMTISAVHRRCSVPSFAVCVWMENLVDLWKVRNDFLRQNNSGDCDWRKMNWEEVNWNEWHLAFHIWPNDWNWRIYRSWCLALVW